MPVLSSPACWPRPSSTRQRPALRVAQTVSDNVPLMIGAGLLVGLGTAVGSGCTSGHGVCGLSLFLPRSLVATLTFMGAGFVTVFLVRHVIGG